MAAASIAIGIAAGSAIGSTVAAHKQANATKAATKMQVDANDRAAAVQGQSASEEMAFKRQQAQIDWANQQQTARANYDQWAAREGRLSSLGVMTGLAPRNIPGFQAGIDPGFDTGGGQPSGAMSPGSPGAPGVSSGGGIDWSAPDAQLASQLSAFFKSKGVSDSEVPYWVSKRPELVARGVEIKNPNYANDRLFAADILGGGNAPAAAKRIAPVSMATMAYAPQTAAPILAPGVTGMQTPYTQRRPYSFADMV